MTSASTSDARPAKRSRGVEAEFRNYDVFISHRGSDTKMGFVSFLCDALERQGLHPFLDCKSIGEGQDSWECIADAIQKTPFAVVIFSENFAQSEWCLKELHEMLACRPSVMVLPIFYNVEPSDLHTPEKGELAAGFAELRERHDQTLIEDWRADLKEASTINGWERRAGDQRLDGDLVKEVVGKIFELANKRVPLFVGDYIVGVKAVAEKLLQTIDEKKVLMLGLWGMGGIGKSTLARELYNQLGQRFGGKCYVEDVVEKVNQGGVPSVQNHLLKALCNESMPNTACESHGKCILEERLSKNRILVVLDDICDADRMGDLMSQKMLKAEGSMCIVTSRNRRAFENSSSFPVDAKVHTHEVQVLSRFDSRSVFECHAFGGDTEAPDGFEFLVGAISKACGGVPLVLKVIGSRLRGVVDVKIWKEVWERLSCCALMKDEKIFKCLRISFDALEKQEKEMFLDIACALLGASVEKAELVWKSEGWQPALGVQSLVEKSLVRVENGEFHMHDHLRDMGREISKQEEMPRRLWGTESLALLNENKPLPDTLETLVVLWRPGVQVDFSVMKGLRILRLTCRFFPLSYPENLRWLEFRSGASDPCNSWLQISSPFRELFSMERLPQSIGNLRKLEVLIFRRSIALLELPNSFGDLQNLKNLDFSGSKIQRLPESFGNLRKLEVLKMVHCGLLMGLPDSFGDLQNLKTLNLDGSGIHCLPESIGNLRKLEVLSLYACDELMGLPDSFGDLQNLKKLDLSETGIQCLPESFGNLRKLEELFLEDCFELVGLPDSFGGLQNLEHLVLRGSVIQCLPESFGNLRKLEVLEECRRLIGQPDSFGGLQNLKNSHLIGSEIQFLPESSGNLRKLEV